MALTQVTKSGITADAVDATKIADDAVDSEHYTDGSIDNAHIADDAINSEHYADGSIDNAHIADDAIDSEHYAAGSIDTAHIADNQITLAKMAGGTDGNIISYDASGDPVAIATGDDGQVLTSAGAGAPPVFEDAAAGGLYSSVAIICDQKAYDANGGTFTNGAWRTRDLNTEIIDADAIVSISSNQFTLAAGTYTVDWSAPAYKVNRHSTRLYNATDTAVINYGQIAFTYSNDYVTTTSIGSSTFTLGGSKALEIQHRAVTTAADEGLGNSQTSDSGAVSIYAIVKILKHS